MNEKKITKRKTNIFDKNINNQYKPIPFNITKNTIGNIKYFPASSKEWKNKIYFFNVNNLKNLPVYDTNINKIIKSYFNLYLKNTILLKKYISNKLKHLSLKKIYISNPEIKHTNFKTTITIYVYNKENLSLLKNIKKLKNILKKNSEILYKLILLNYNKNNIKNIQYNLYKKIIKIIIYKELILIRKHKLNINLNKYKFEDLFLYKLGKLINKFYNRKIEFNIINLNSIVFHTDILTEFLKQKLKRKRIDIFRIMNFILNKVNLPKVNTIRKRGKLIKNVDSNLLENKYTNLNINSIVNKNNLDQKLKELYNNIFFKKEYIYYKDFSIENISVSYIKYILKKNIIFNEIKYKNIGGIRLEVKGRLTKRYRADRAIFKVRWKGGLKNIDSSFRGLSVVNVRGYKNSNVEYSLRSSKRRIGAFAVKGWISGK